MRLLTVMLLVVVVLAQSWRVGVLGSVYTWQKSYITQAYCVNIELTQQMCQGKCYFKQVIQAAVPQDNTRQPGALPVSTDDLSPVWALLEALAELPAHQATIQNTRFSPHLNWDGSPYAAAVFHPPRA